MFGSKFIETGSTLHRPVYFIFF